MLALAKNTKIARVMNAKAAGATAQNGTTVDMQNWEGVMFVALFGALTATQVTSIKAQQSGAKSSGFSDLEGTEAGPLDDEDSNKALVLDIKNPRERYVRCVASRATANAVIDGVVAIQYGPRKMPAAHDSTVVASEAHAGPAEGTA